ncbi:MAG: cytochrome c biogenesis protein CcsA [Neisseria sp.]|uniref:cytochrome C assembly family protein n=1 Tax=Neisseria sp. TaxID=192066 RepID=UPI0026DC91F0|nr:cytochrome c biogenesis protein CcsA [Neisseria sp.]MDO4642179.1 cytochrome c biogenesis protein CcsA [Neisseria sp.]
MPVLLILLILVYAALAVFVWKCRSKGDSDVYPLKIELSILAPATLIHGAMVASPVLVDKVLVMGFGYALNLIVWLMLVMYFAGSFFYSLRGLQLLLYPVAAVSLLLAVVFPGRYTGYSIENLPFMLHIGTSLVAYSMFSIVTLLSVLILWLSRDLHKHKFSLMVSFLPSLLSLEKLMFQGMWVGFILLTVSVVSGTFFAEEVFGRPFTFTHKSIFGILSWLIYGALLLKRSMTAWRGKNAAIWTIIGFISLMLAYVGSKFVLEVLLRR